MTPEEHLLMVSLFFKQQQAIRILLTMLRSRDLLTADDEDAFVSLQMEDVGSNAAIYEQALETYLKIANAAGVETGLEPHTKFPLDWFRRSDKP